MRCDAQGLVYRRGELVDLVHRLHVPETDRLILAHRNNDALTQVEVHVQYLISVRSEHRAILLIRLVEHADTPVECAAHDLEAVGAYLYGADRALVFGLHEELAEVQGPHPQIGVLTTRNTERLVHRDTIDGGIISLVSGLEALGVVVDLKDHAMLGADEEALEGLILLRVDGPQTILEIETGKYGVSRVVIEDDGGPADAPVVLDAPETDVFLAAGGHPRGVDGAEPQGQDVEVGRLLRDDLRLPTAWRPDTRDVPHYNQLFIVRVLPHTRQVLPIVGKSQTFQGVHWHGHHADAAACRVLPDPDYRILSLLSTSNEGTIGIDIETADGSGVPEVETLLAVVL